MQSEFLDHAVNFDSELLLDTVSVLINGLLPELEHLKFILITWDPFELSVEQVKGLFRLQLRLLIDEGSEFFVLRR